MQQKIDRRVSNAHGLVADWLRAHLRLGPTEASKAATSQEQWLNRNGYCICRQADLDIDCDGG